MNNVNKSILNKLEKEFGHGIVDRLRRGEPITGAKAWGLYEYLRGIGGRIIYEDEEVDDRECYIVFMKLIDNLFFALVKNGNKTKAYILEHLSEKQVEKILDIYNRCLG